MSTQEGYILVSWDAVHTRKKQFHTNIMRTIGAKAGMYLKSYAFKPFSLHDSSLVTSNSRNSSSRNLARDNTWSGIHRYMRARVIGSVESVWNLFEYCNVKFDLQAAAHTINLEIEKSIFTSHSSVPSNLSDWRLPKWFRRPSLYKIWIFWSIWSSFFCLKSFQ